MQPVQSKLYLHSEKESCRDRYQEICKEYDVEPNEEAESDFAYAGYEVGLDIEVDLTTGHTMCVGVNGHKLESPFKLV